MKLLSSLVFMGLVSVGMAQNATPTRPETFQKDSAVDLDQLTKLANEPGAKAGAWVNLGNGLMQKTREKLDHDFSAAGAAYTRALDLQPDLLDALVGMAWVKNSEHDFRTGKWWAERALEVDSFSVDAHSLMGDGAVEVGNYDTAFDQYQAALDVRADLSTLSRAAHLLWVTGNVTKATELMQKAISAGGNYPENTAWCRSELALMYFQGGALVSAEQQASKALTAAPENPRVLSTMARILAAKKDYQGAIGLYEKSATLTPNHDALAALVDLYQITDQPDKAAQQFDKVVAFHKSASIASDGNLPLSGPKSNRRTHFHPPGNLQLARFYADHGKNPEEALYDAQAGYSLYKNVGATDTLAWCFYQSGKLDDARKMIANAIKWNTPDAEIYFHAGMIELALKNQGEAKRYFSKALSMNPVFHPIHAKQAADLLAEPVVVSAR